MFVFTFFVIFQFFACLFLVYIILKTVASVVPLYLFEIRIASFFVLLLLLLHKNIPNRMVVFGSHFLRFLFSSFCNLLFSLVGRILPTTLQYTRLHCTAVLFSRKSSELFFINFCNNLHTTYAPWQRQKSLISMLSTAASRIFVVVSPCCFKKCFCKLLF